MGYVGLPTALARVASGGRVVGIDISSRRLDAIRSGHVDLVPSDRDRLQAALETDRFVLTDDISALTRAACVVVCVPTPVDEHLVPDLGALAASCASVVEHAAPGQVIILTSTTYVGTTRDLLVKPLAARGLMPGVNVCVAFSPERIDPGNTHAHEAVPRVVGGVTPRCTERAAAHLSASVDQVHQVSSPEVAELTKLLENTFRAVNIALVNEFADVSSLMGLDIVEVIGAAATKPYGFMPFTPGPGVGGHCIPCDPHYLLWQLQRESTEVPLIQTAMRDIAQRPHTVIRRAGELLAHHGKSIVGARVVMVGIAYKPDVDDVRESTALTIIPGLEKAGAVVSYHDPHVPSVRLGQVESTSCDLDEMAAADLVIVHTLHSSFDRSLFEDDDVLVLDTSYRLNPSPTIVRL